jgi:hypothetical protein
VNGRVGDARPTVGRAKNSARPGFFYVQLARAGFEPRRGIATSLASMVLRTTRSCTLQRARMAQIRRVDVDRNGASWARRDFRPTDHGLRFAHPLGYWLSAIGYSASSLSEPSLCAEQLLELLNLAPTDEFFERFVVDSLG